MQRPAVIEEKSAPNPAEYDAASITVLEGLEAVRKRPGMYVGDTGTYGLHHLVYEVVDNAVDEALAGVCTDIQVVIHVDNSISVKDNGRGIPVGPHPTVQGMDTVDVVMTKLHAGGKFEHSAYKVSGGLHGVGVSCVNALSEWLKLEIQREGKVYEQRYARGIPQQQVAEIGVTDLRGTKVSFKPDATIFEVVELNFDTLSQRLRELAFLNAGLQISITDERTSKSHEFKFDGGIVSFVQYINKSKQVLHEAPIFLKAEKDEVQLDIAMQFAGRPQEGLRVAWQASDGDLAPVLDGALATFRCRPWQAYDGGDHVLQLGQVAEADVSSEEEPLLFDRGRFAMVGLSLFDHPRVIEADPVIGGGIIRSHLVHHLAAAS